MKLFLLKPNNKENLPSLKTLRPKIFDIDKSWFMGLGLSFLILLVTAFIGFKLFYGQYFETYRNVKPSENYDNIIDTSRLGNVIDKRIGFINKERVSLEDPSL